MWDCSSMSYIIELKKSIGEKKMIWVIFLDLKRAFELVDKDIMLKKMESYGIYMLYRIFFLTWLSEIFHSIIFNDTKKLFDVKGHLLWWAKNFSQGHIF